MDFLRYSRHDRAVFFDKLVQVGGYGIRNCATYEIIQCVFRTRCRPELEGKHLFLTWLATRHVMDAQSKLAITVFPRSIKVKPPALSERVRVARVSNTIV